MVPLIRSRQPDMVSPVQKPSITFDGHLAVEGHRVGSVRTAGVWAEKNHEVRESVVGRPPVRADATGFGIPVEDVDGHLPSSGWDRHPESVVLARPTDALDAADPRLT